MKGAWSRQAYAIRAVSPPPPHTLAYSSPSRTAWRFSGPTGPPQDFTGPRSNGVATLARQEQDILHPSKYRVVTAVPDSAGGAGVGAGCSGAGTGAGTGAGSGAGTGAGSAGGSPPPPRGTILMSAQFQKRSGVTLPSVPSSRSLAGNRSPYFSRLMSQVARPPWPFWRQSGDGHLYAS